MLKKILLGLAGLGLLLIVALIGLSLSLNPNDYKPQIQRLAADQGIGLQINGELGWQLYPQLALELNNIEVSNLQTAGQPLAQLQHAAIGVALMPLFKGEIKAQQIIIEGARIDARIAADGQSNWQLGTQSADQPDNKPAATPSPSANVPASDSPQALELSIDNISILDSQLNFDDRRSGRQLQVDKVNLQIEGVNLKGAAFPISVSAAISDSELPADIAFELSSQLSVNSDFSQLQLQQGQLQLDFSRPQANSRITSHFNLKVEQDQQLQYSGDLALSPFDLKQLLTSLGQVAPATQNPDALSNLAFSGQFSGSEQQFELKSMKLTLDQSHIEGQLTLADFNKQSLRLELQGDQLNIDHYLPPSTEDKPQTTSTTSSSKKPQAKTKTKPTAPAANKPQPEADIIPLELIRQLDIEARFGFDRLTAAKLNVTKLDSQLTARNGVVKLQPLSLELYDGTLQAQGRLDARGPEAKFSLSSSLAGVELEPLLQDAAAQQNLAGKIASKIRANSRGNSVSALQANARAKAQVSGASLKLQPINLEQGFCKLAQLVEGKSQTKDWPAYTQLQDFSAELRLAGQRAHIDNIQAGAGNLALKAEGLFNLTEQDFNILINTRLTGEASSEDGCSIKNERWRNRDLPLRCKGQVDDLSAKTCLPDSGAMKQLLSDEAKYKTEKALQKKLRDKLGGDKGDAVNQLLKGLLR